MICPYCAHDITEVIATIRSFTTERWRKCKKCGKTFCTTEKVMIDKNLVEIIKEMEENNKEKDKK